jgi:hypothetical protein
VNTPHPRAARFDDPPGAVARILPGRSRGYRGRTRAMKQRSLPMGTSPRGPVAERSPLTLEAALFAGDGPSRASQVVSVYRRNGSAGIHSSTTTMALVPWALVFLIYVGTVRRCSISRARGEKEFRLRSLGDGVGCRSTSFRPMEQVRRRRDRGALGGDSERVPAVLAPRRPIRRHFRRRDARR